MGTQTHKDYFLIVDPMGKHLGNPPSHHLSHFYLSPVTLLFITSYTFITVFLLALFMCLFLFFACSIYAFI